MTTAVGNYNSYATSVAIQSDGKIVVAGDAFDQGSSEVFAVVRYNTDGSLDTAFGTDGIVMTGVWGGHLPPNQSPSRATGRLWWEVPPLICLLIILHLSVTLPMALWIQISAETAFVTTSLGGNYSLAYDFAIDGNGKIVAVGKQIMEVIPILVLRVTILTGRWIPRSAGTALRPRRWGAGMSGLIQ